MSVLVFEAFEEDREVYTLRWALIVVDMCEVDAQICVEVQRTLVCNRTNHTVGQAERFIFSQGAA